MSFKILVGKSEHVSLVDYVLYNCSLLGQDQVSERVSVSCRHATPLHPFFGNLVELGKTSSSFTLTRS